LSPESIWTNKHQFVGSGAANFLTSQIQILAAPTLRGILGSFGDVPMELYQPVALFSLPQFPPSRYRKPQELNSLS
jgi:hypothetical protein